MELKVDIEVNGIKMTLDEAKELYEELAKLFEKEKEYIYAPTTGTDTQPWQIGWDTGDWYNNQPLSIQSSNGLTGTITSATA